jgi:asparagine N-glycosylation enzyme membrane subunit Stt3
MAIYDIFETEQEENSPPNNQDEEEGPYHKRDRLFSALAARLFFFLLLLADVLWCGYALLIAVMSGLLSLLTLRKVPYFKKTNSKAWISVKRSLVCGLALLIALFSPAFGIMVACTYFLMYDKAGIEEVVPSSLQSQFKEFFQQK